MSWVGGVRWLAEGRGLLGAGRRDQVPQEGGEGRGVQGESPAREAGVDGGGCQSDSSASQSSCLGLGEEEEEEQGDGPEC